MSRHRPEPEPMWRELLREAGCLMTALWLGSLLLGLVALCAFIWLAIEAGQWLNAN